MSPLSQRNQSAGHSPLSDVERTSSQSSGGSTGGIPVDGFSGIKVVTSGISVVSSGPSPDSSTGSSPEPSSGWSIGGILVVELIVGVTVEGSSGVTGSLTSGLLVVIPSMLTCTLVLML